jgi:hypothetical protein
MYKFNANLELDHISPGHRMALYLCNYVDGDRLRSWSCDGAVALVACDGKFFVVSFDKHLFCNNASELPHEKAWDFFDEIRRALRREADEREGARRMAEETADREPGGSLDRESDIGVRTGDFLRGLLD